jgi:acetate kinase
VFTGGIGEHAAPVRQQICSNLGWLGITMDAQANTGQTERMGATLGNFRISQANSAVPVLVVPTNEEWMIARHTANLLR